MANYVEVRGRGKERRSLHKLVIEASGDSSVTVSKTFEGEHAPEEKEFALDQGHGLLEYISECLQIDPEGEMFAGPKFGHALVGEEHAPTDGESESGEEY